MTADTPDPRPDPDMDYERRDAMLGVVRKTYARPVSPPSELTAEGQDMLANHSYRRPVTREWIAAIEAEAAARAAPQADTRCQAIWNGCRCGRKPHEDDRHVWMNSLDGYAAVDPARYPARAASQPSKDGPADEA